MEKIHSQMMNAHGNVGKLELEHDPANNPATQESEPQTCFSVAFQKQHEDYIKKWSVRNYVKVTSATNLCRLVKDWGHVQHNLNSVFKSLANLKADMMIDEDSTSEELPWLNILRFVCHSDGLLYWM